MGSVLRNCRCDSLNLKIDLSQTSLIILLLLLGLLDTREVRSGGLVESSVVSAVGRCDIVVDNRVVEEDVEAGSLLEQVEPLRPSAPYR